MYCSWPVVVYLTSTVLFISLISLALDVVDPYYSSIYMGVTYMCAGRYILGLAPSVHVGGVISGGCMKRMCPGHTL